MRIISRRASRGRLYKNYSGRPGRHGERVSMANMVCTRCHESLLSLIVLAMLTDAGCTVSGHIERCLNGKEHDFQKVADEP